MHIALLEDNASILEIFSVVLTKTGYLVSTYTYGDSLLTAFTGALDSQGRLPCDLLIVDLHLPGALSGLDVIEQVQHLSAPQLFPTIVVSAASDHELALVQTRYPTFPILKKPLKLSALLQAIASLRSPHTMCD